jgi:type III secretion system FlhB-like substrate exporter
MQAMPEIPVKIMMNVGNPEQAFHFCTLPHEGVGLARLEFIINNAIGIHPNAALEYRKMPEDVKTAIDAKIHGYGDPVNFYVEKLVEGIATIACAFWPKRVIVRMSDFKSNEYANLIGGPQYEPHEENPMLGFRGAGRYASPMFRRAFQLECRAISRVRDDMGLTNVEIMLPFVRTLFDADAALGVLAENGLERGKDGLKIVMMCEIPANVLLADEFLQRFDGFSIGSNDLTQLTLGVDRDSSLVAASFDERNPAVKKLLAEAIAACKRNGKYVGICGQGPSDHPDLAGLADGSGHRFDVAESGYRGEHLDAAGGAASVSAFTVIVLLDVPFQIWNYHHGQRMTKEEVRQEGKEIEGDPQIKARIRSLQREVARRRMMQAIPQADVVVTNPLHFAVALKYEEKGMSAPVVVAKGSQLVAERIKELAREHRVPVVEAPPLARALHRHVEVGDVVPGALFTAVAQVLAYVYQLNRSLDPALPLDWQVPPDLDPAARNGAT